MIIRNISEFCVQSKVTPGGLVTSLAWQGGIC